MHIGLVSSGRADGFGENIGETLVAMGHRVSRLDATGPARRSRLGNRVSATARAAMPGLADRSHQRLARAALARECDAVITVLGDLAPAAVATLRRNRLPVALWFPDHVGSLGRQRMLAAPYTALFFKDPSLVDRLRRTLDLPVWYLPQACNPRRHRPIGEPGTEREIAVVGNCYPSRALLLRRLYEAGLPLRIYGAPPPHYSSALLPGGTHSGRAVFREEKSRVFRGAGAVLNNLYPAEMDGTNLRLFEATAAGAAVLCEHRPALAALFDPDTEVVPYRDLPELVARARELLAEPEHARKLGDNASRRAHAEHTYQHRLPFLLEKLV